MDPTVRRRDMRLPATLLAAAAGLFMPSFAAAQSEWDRYVPGQLQVLVRRADAMLSPPPDAAADGPALVPSTDFPTKAVVVYTGRVRPLTPERVAVIVAWVEAVREDSATVLSHLQREVLFTENGGEFWVPVQEPLIAPMEAEVGAGNSLVVFVTWMGAFRRGAELQSVFAVHEFDAKVIARVVELGPFGRLTLGSPVLRADEVLEPGSQPTRVLRKDVYEGADSILVTLGPNAVLEGLRFVYGPYQTFDGLRDNALPTMGLPRELTAGLPPGVRRSVVWCDRSSRAELQLRAGPPERVHMVMTNRDERSSC